MESWETNQITSINQKPRFFYGTWDCKENSWKLLGVYILSCFCPSFIQVKFLKIYALARNDMRVANDMAN